MMITESLYILVAKVDMKQLFIPRCSGLEKWMFVPYSMSAEQLFKFNWGEINFGLVFFLGLSSLCFQLAPEKCCISFTSSYIVIPFFPLVKQDWLSTSPFQLACRPSLWVYQSPNTTNVWIRLLPKRVHCKAILALCCLEHVMCLS